MGYCMKQLRRVCIIYQIISSRDRFFMARHVYHSMIGLPSNDKTQDNFCLWHDQLLTTKPGIIYCNYWYDRLWHYKLPFLQENCAFKRCNLLGKRRNYAQLGNPLSISVQVFQARVTNHGRTQRNAKNFNEPDTGTMDPPVFGLGFLVAALPSILWRLAHPLACHAALQSLIRC